MPTIPRQPHRRVAASPSRAVFAIIFALVCVGAWLSLELVPSAPAAGGRLSPRDHTVVAVPDGGSPPVVARTPPSFADAGAAVKPPTTVVAPATMVAPVMTQPPSHAPSSPSGPTPCPTEVRFRTPEEVKAAKERVLLFSFPGSGNTWVRLMLENVTGVCVCCVRTRSVCVGGGT